MSGMTLMYLLMSAFHVAPWLRLISSRHKRCPPDAWWFHSARCVRAGRQIRRGIE
jgi:hypothetical protein